MISVSVLRIDQRIRARFWVKKLRGTARLVGLAFMSKAKITRILAKIEVQARKLSSKTAVADVFAPQIDRHAYWRLFLHAVHRPPIDISGSLNVRLCATEA
jgi:hypothetical protein